VALQSLKIWKVALLTPQLCAVALQSLQMVTLEIPEQQLAWILEESAVAMCRK
jgi:hypothetical protein